MRSTFIFALISLRLLSVLSAPVILPWMEEGTKEVDHLLNGGEKEMQQSTKKVENLLTTGKVLPPEPKPGTKMMEYVNGWKQRKAEAQAAAKAAEEADRVERQARYAKWDKELLNVGIKPPNFDDGAAIDVKAAKAAKEAAEKTPVGAESLEQIVTGGKDKVLPHVSEPKPVRVEKAEGEGEGDIPRGKEGKEEIEPKPVNVVEKAEGKGPMPPSGEKKGPVVSQPKTFQDRLSFFKNLGKESKVGPVVPPKAAPKAAPNSAAKFFQDLEKKGNEGPVVPPKAAPKVALNTSAPKPNSSAPKDPAPKESALNDPASKEPTSKKPVRWVPKKQQ